MSDRILETVAIALAAQAVFGLEPQRSPEPVRI